MNAWKDILGKLETRGIEVNPPIRAEDIPWDHQIVELFSRNRIFELYKMFDGFGENTADFRSQISIWPMWKIYKFNKEEKISPDGSCVVGDFLIESDFITLNPDGTIHLLNDGRTLSPSMFDLIRKIADGELDFLE
jgi:hypothetical protein